MEQDKIQSYSRYIIWNPQVSRNLHRIFIFGWRISLRIFWYLAEKKTVTLIKNRIFVLHLICLSIARIATRDMKVSGSSGNRFGNCCKNLIDINLTHAFCVSCISVHCLGGHVTGKAVDNSSVQSNPSTHPDSAHTPPGPSPAVFSKCPLTAVTSPTFPSSPCACVWYRSALKSKSLPLNEYYGNIHPLVPVRIITFCSHW